jgi:hypothetical protein
VHWLWWLIWLFESNSCAIARAYYGMHNFIEDWRALLAGARLLRSDRTCVVGKNVAITPGKVVDDADRAAGTRSDRARLDREVIHSGPVATQFSRPLPGRKRLHRLHDLMEEPNA